MRTLLAVMLVMFALTAQAQGAEPPVKPVVPQPDGPGTAPHLCYKSPNADVRIFPATLTRVLDGDTIEVNLDLGFETTKHARLRLLGIKAPEKFCKRGRSQDECRKQKKAAVGASAFTKDWCEKASSLEFRMVGYGKSGRPLGYVCSGKDCLNYDLLTNGLAAYYCGDKR